VPDFEHAWLRALAHACGPRNRLVTSAEVARALPEVERVVGRITAQAAAVNLARLAAQALADVRWDEGRKRWRLTEAGVHELTSAAPSGPRSESTTPPGASAPDATLSGRLADLVNAYNAGDLDRINRALATDVVLFIPGFNAMSGTYAGRGQVISLLNQSHGRSLPDLRVVERVEEAEEARVRVLAEAVSPTGEGVEVELWIRAQADFDGLIVQAVIQPEDQRAFDAAVGRRTSEPSPP
jgi:hypothetical protein